MKLSGYNFIGNENSAKGKNLFNAVNPGSGSELEPSFYETTADEVAKAAQFADDAFKTYRYKSGQEKAVFLEAIADEIISLGDDLIDRCVLETGLPETRITGERGRTINQLKLFATMIKEGSWLDARIDLAQPDREPIPKPDIRSMQIPLGPVGIFGASNFPLAFSVAGGDSASALAAGCPIVVKAHPAHPGTCEFIATAIIHAIKKTGMPEGTFNMVHGISSDSGMSIVENPLIKAIGFTGSYQGGKAIFDAACRRPLPIPVYAEMGSANPVFILPGAMAEKGDDIVQGLTASVTLGVGQFCTNPGLVFLEDSDDGNTFKNAILEKFKEAPSGTMLTSTIQKKYLSRVTELNSHNDVEIVATGKSQGEGFQGIPSLLHTNSKIFISDPQLEEEIFGPSTLLVSVNNKSELLNIAENLSGHLTTTVWANHNDLDTHKELIEILTTKAGRLIINGFPTGVEVCHSMIHGGPFPATTDSRSTSVGTTAIRRFTRPVCYQNVPDTHLPDELKKDNPLNIWRLVDGKLSK